MICPTRRGAGARCPKECPTCKEAGTIQFRQTIEIRLPLNLPRSYNIVVPEAGNAGKAVNLPAI